MPALPHLEIRYVKLSDILTLVRQSVHEDWQTIDNPVIGSWEVSTPLPGDSKSPSHVIPAFHHTYAVYRGDIDISLAMGLRHLEDYHAPWMPKDAGFPDDEISSCYVDLRYRGQVIQRWIMIFLDGARYLIPPPDVVPGSVDLHADKAQWYVPRDKYEFARLFATFLVASRADVVDEALQRIGLEVEGVLTPRH